ncbi:MAG: TMEM175 family protein [Gemmatimonadaceae bacterium]
MIRKHIFGKNSKRDSGFEWRSNEPSRLEGLSDAVIGFAVTLLVVSLEVPKTFEELAHAISGFFAFGICFLLLVLIWHAQYVWFRRYALSDSATVFLTMLLLFVVLFFVYPLKFFTAFSVEWVRTGHFPETMIKSNEEFLQLAVIYSVGYAAVYGIFALMYWHAWRQREQLDLSDVEQLETRYSMVEHSIYLGVGLLAIAIATIVRSPYAMFAFFLIAPLQTVQGRMRSRARKKIVATQQPPS